MYLFLFFVSGTLFGFLAIIFLYSRLAKDFRFSDKETKLITILISISIVICTGIMGGGFITAIAWCVSKLIELLR